MKQLEITKAKELRGSIMERLYDIRGEDIPISSLKNMLRYKTAHVTDRSIKMEIDYLSGEGKKYVQVVVTEKSMNDFMAAYIRITPMGVNLVEGDMQDAGVLMNG